MGVRRAVEMAWRESAAQEGPVYTLGPLIHNPRVLENLKERGIRILEEGSLPPHPEKSTIIIRAHGVPPMLEAEFHRLGMRVLDATCPNVKQSQTKARFFAENGYRIFLAGEENHGEIIGIRGYIETHAPSSGPAPSCYVVGNPQDAEKAAAELLRLQPDAKTVLIAQTTISANEYRAIGERLRHFFPAIKILHTICSATAERQESLRELCGQVCAVIIAGGRESANTRRLLSLAGELGRPAWLAQTAADIPPEIRTYKIVVLSAGASTPDSLITEIEEALRAL